MAGAGSSVDPWGPLVFICIMFAHAPVQEGIKQQVRCPQAWAVMQAGLPWKRVEAWWAVMLPRGHTPRANLSPPPGGGLRGHGRSPPLQMVFPMGIPTGFMAARSGAKRWAVTRDLR